MRQLTKNSKFQCFPASSGALLTTSPKSTIEKVVNYSTNPSASINRRLSQPLRGINSERFSGMLTSLGSDTALDFLQEPRSGFIEKHMSDILATEFGAGPKVSSTPSISASPLQRAQRKLKGLIPKRS